MTKPSKNTFVFEQYNPVDGNHTRHAIYVKETETNEYLDTGYITPNVPIKMRSGK
jgi:hypothetical protein